MKRNKKVETVIWLLLIALAGWLILFNVDLSEDQVFVSSDPKTIKEKVLQVQVASSPACPEASSAQAMSKRVPGCFDYFEYRLDWTPELCEENSDRPYCSNYGYFANRLAPTGLRPSFEPDSSGVINYLTHCSEEAPDFTNLDSYSLRVMRHLDQTDYQATPTANWKKFGTCAQVLPWFQGSEAYFDQLYANLYVWITDNRTILLPTAIQHGHLTTTYEDLAFKYSRGITFTARQQGYSDHLDYLVAECRQDPDSGRQFLVGIRIYLQKNLLRYSRIKRPAEAKIANECIQGEPIYVKTLVNQPAEQ